jgi:TonB family protein
MILTKNKMFELLGIPWLYIAVSLFFPFVSGAEDSHASPAAPLIDYTLDNPKPEYPKESLKANETGTVSLKILILPSGEVKQVLVDKSSGFAKLDLAASQAVQKWHFMPWQSMEGALEQWTVVQITFQEEGVSLGAFRQIEKRYWTVDQKGCQLFDYNLQRSAKYIWSGECNEGYIEGAGELQVLENGLEISNFRGSYRKGLLNGQAVMKTPFDSQYQGEFVNGLKHGKGTQVWKHGMRYEGDFVHNMRTGHGVISYANGVRYEGEFVKGLTIDKVIEPPVFTLTKKLTYPESLVHSFITGEVFFQAVISERGDISDIEILKSDHAAFEKEVLRVIAGLKVKPTTLNGRPVPYLYCQKVRFGPGNSDRDKPYRFVPDTSGESVEDLSAHIQADILPTFKVVAPLVYPFELAKNNKSGRVVATVLVDPSGHPAEITILQASHDDFAAATRAMLASSSFTPAVKGLIPVWSSLKLEHNFSRENIDTLFDKHVSRILRRSKDNNADIYKLADLDQKPTAFYRPLPELPYGYQVRGDEKVLVEFYIDKTGTVQFPHVLKASHPDLGWLAVTAISRWHFQPPTVKGEPVDVLVSVPVVYNTSSQDTRTQ